MCLGTNVFGHNHVWAQIKCVWAQTYLGTNVSGRKCVWAQSCLGTIIYWHKRGGTTGVSVSAARTRLHWEGLSHFTMHLTAML